MNINRHNYEEFFILYMDNELNSADRRMVEVFVQNNPDLKDELDILLQSRLVPDNNIVFEKKEELMRLDNVSSINLANYEEWLTLYVDDELNSKQRIEVENFIAAYPQIKNEFAILQKTKLQPEKIVFPYKESLYRRAEKVRVIQMRWWRVAAAAVLLLAFSVTGFFVLNRKTDPNKVVKTTPSQNNPTPVDQKTDEGKLDQKQSDNPSTVLPENNLAKVQDKEQKLKSDENKSENNNNQFVRNELPEKVSAKKQNQEIANNNSPSNNLPEPLYNPNVKPQDTNPVIANSEISNKKLNPSQTYDGLVTNGITETSGIRLASQIDDDNLIPDEGGSNKKSRGLFRKAVRFFKKTTGVDPSNDDDKVLIGALAVKLK